MKRPWTLDLGYTRHYGATVSVEAETLEQAIPAAIREADENERWKDTGHASDAYALAACTGADGCPWDGPVSALAIPDRFTERGEPPVVTLTDPSKPAGGIEVSGGRVLLRFRSDAGTVTTELCDPPHPPANKPLVTVRRGPDGRPDVTVTEGRARIRILDE